jgi:hypothetical protein
MVRKNPRWKNHDSLVFLFSYGGLFKLYPYASDDADGVVKIITDAATDRILGAHIIGPVSFDAAFC